MPLHDWTRVDAGIFHDFHTTWIGIIRTRLNSGLLPADYFALAEQVAGKIGPDVLTLREPVDDADESESDAGGGLAVATAPPKVHRTAEAEARIYTARQRRLAIRHTSGNRIIAILEIVSSGNKSSRHEFQRFLDKAIATLEAGIHLLFIDVQPPGPRDPHGLHAALWEEMTGEIDNPPPGKDRTLVAYSAGMLRQAYVEPVAVGQALTPMPLFLTADRYINVPLEETYQAAYEGVPRIYRQKLES